MRCSEVRKQLEECESSGFAAPVRDHLAVCRACRAEAESLKLLQAGFMALAREAIPELSVGFVARLMHRLNSAELAVDPAREFLERAGRRVLYASLAIALTVLLA